ncbi:NAD(P)-dependent alcohol dehydrogenase [Actinoplanes sp. NPDC051851]|uniref:NAD(P)-dependent alcohol dehydrogenase n=1 Tax=Actinoplanes sp. NPDC051851 TaxID=3154753 RepID=UPI00342DF410
MRARAALVEEPGGPFTIHDVEIGEPRDDEILVAMAAVGVCHTDLSMRRQWPAARTPMVFGHEGAGTVLAVGAGVTTVAPGDAVCLSYRSCAACDECRAGHPAYCLRSGLNTRGTRPDGTTPLTRNGAPVYGGFFGQSSFATHAIAYQSNTIRVPADLPPVIAAPLGCGVQTGAGTVFNVLDPAPGDSVVIFGGGGVGLSALLAAVSRDCAVTVVEPVASRRALALSLGAVAALDPSGKPPGGFHHAVDTTGRSDVIGTAISALRRRGTLALVGIGTTATVDVMTVLYHGIRIRGVIEGDADPATFLPYLIDLYRQGRLPVDKLVTEYPFAEIEAAATGAAVKPVLTFGGDRTSG